MGYYFFARQQLYYFAVACASLRARSAFAAARIPSMPGSPHRKKGDLSSSLPLYFPSIARRLDESARHCSVDLAAGPKWLSRMESDFLQRLRALLCSRKRSFATRSVNNRSHCVSHNTSVP